MSGGETSIFHYFFLVKVKLFVLTSTVGKNLLGMFAAQNRSKENLMRSKFRNLATT